MEEFLSQEDGVPRAAVKRLTAAIERELTQATINAPDWSVTLHRIFINAPTSGFAPTQGHAICCSDGTRLAVAGRKVHQS